MSPSLQWRALPYKEDTADPEGGCTGSRGPAAQTGALGGTVAGPVVAAGCPENIS